VNSATPSFRPNEVRAGIHNHDFLDVARLCVPILVWWLWIPGSRLRASTRFWPRPRNRRAANAPPPVRQGAGTPVVPFSVPSEEGNGAPGGARGLRGPLGFPLRSGNRRAADGAGGVTAGSSGCQDGVANPVPRRARLMLRGCEARDRDAAPPGAPSRAACGGPLRARSDHVMTAILPRARMNGSSLLYIFLSRDYVHNYEANSTYCKMSKRGR